MDNLSVSAGVGVGPCQQLVHIEVLIMVPSHLWRISESSSPVFWLRVNISSLSCIHNSFRHTYVKLLTSWFEFDTAELRTIFSTQWETVSSTTSSFKPQILLRFWANLSRAPYSFVELSPRNPNFPSKLYCEPRVRFHILFMFAWCVSAASLRID